MTINWIELTVKVDYNYLIYLITLLKIELNASQTWVLRKLEIKLTKHIIISLIDHISGIKVTRHAMNYMIFVN